MRAVLLLVFVACATAAPAPLQCPLPCTAEPMVEDMVLEHCADSPRGVRVCTYSDGGRCLGRLFRMSCYEPWIPFEYECEPDPEASAP
jgi:hypothetical protein